MRVCDRCHRPGELATALPDALSNPIDLCARCTSDFFAWVAEGADVKPRLPRKQRSDKGTPRPWMRRLYLVEAAK